MIFTDRTIIVQKGTSSINDTIVLYRGDKDVEIRFSLNEGSPFKFGSGASPNIIEKTEAAYGQLIIKRPNDLPAVFSEIAPTNGGKIVFTITAEMIDEITEVGNYTFQIRLLDESRNSRATLPEVVNGIEIREPIASEDVSTTNEVGVATVGYALTTAGTTEDAFDTQGNYNKTTWGTGDRITASKLNKMETGIDEINKKAASGGTGGNVDLSNYVTKETGNASQITFADGQSFQDKLNAGTLKGNNGDKGDPGSTEASGVSIQDTANNFTATNVEGALAELFQSVSNGKSLIASAITDMGVATSNTDSFETMANKIRRIIGNVGERPLYKFGLLSDVHIDGDGTDEALSISDLNNAITFLQNAGANFIAYCGDMSYDGRDEDYVALKTCLQASTVPNYCVRGNHDALSLSNSYSHATGCEDDYIVTQGNDLLIFLSPATSDTDTGGLTTAKLDWLENLLQTNTATRVFLFYHYYVKGTSGEGTEVFSYNTLNPSNEIALRFINMVKQYPNLIYCNGHSHVKFSIQDANPNANYYHNNGECYYIHVPSCAYPRSINGSTIESEFEGSEGYLVEVYASKVVFKPIDFIASEYLTRYNYTANVVQGTNAPTTPPEPAEPSLIDITWRDGVKIDRSTGAETADSNYSASDFIDYNSNNTYKLAISIEFSLGNVFPCFYDSNKSFISCGTEYIGAYDTTTYECTLSKVENAKYIKLRLSGVSSLADKSVITLTTTNATS